MSVIKKPDLTDPKLRAKLAKGMGHHYYGEPAWPNDILYIFPVHVFQQLFWSQYSTNGVARYLFIQLFFLQHQCWSSLVAIGQSRYYQSTFTSHTLSWHS